jgi:hypothetical protein
MLALLLLRPLPLQLCLLRLPRLLRLLRLLRLRLDCCAFEPRCSHPLRHCQQHCLRHRSEWQRS